MGSDAFHAFTFLVKLAIGGVAFVFWLRMLCECAIEELAGRKKTLWAMGIFFGQIFGALAYYIVRRPQRYAEQGR